MNNIQKMSKKFGINAEEKNALGSYPAFLRRVKGKKICVLCDENTVNFTQDIFYLLNRNKNDCSLYVYPEKEPVADEAAIASASAASEKSDYILAVGAGTLNDIAKYSAFISGKKSGVLVTAPSMDGFSSGVTPLIINGEKITKNAQTAADVLIDYEVIKTAPSIMKGAGVGDILAKICSLSDWRLSSALFGESVNEEAFSLMNNALKKCEDRVKEIVKGDKRGLSALMEALLVSGYAMVVAGNSRPASGAEHHMSHYLEMDYLKRGEKIPLHGVKVGIGTEVSLWLYKNLKNLSFDGAEKAANIAEALPEYTYVEEILKSFGCPTRFSEIGAPKDTVYKMLFEAYKLRDRFTVLALYNRYGFIKGCADEIMDRFY